MARQGVSTTRAAGAAMLCLMLAGCTSTLTADDYELRNMSPDNIVPKSSPKAFVAAFSSYCLEPGSPAATRARLRSGNYVPAPRKLGRMEVWVVDDRRPAVLLSETECVVLAKARTGQTERARQLVRDRFPTAVPMTDARFESLWQIPGTDRSTLIFTQRNQANEPESQFMLCISLGK